MSQVEEKLGKVGLSKTLKLSRPTIDKFLKMPGAPVSDDGGLFDVVKVKEFIVANKRRGGAPITTGLNSVQARKIALECEKLEHDMKMRRGEFIDTAEAKKTLAALALELDTLMQQKFEEELPSRYKGMTAMECAKLNASGRDAISRRFRHGVSKIANSVA